MSKPKFLGGFKAGNPINLWLGVSLDNSKLRGDNLAVFAHIANKHAKFIKKLYIIVGCEIYGHYVGADMAKKMGDAWVEESENYFNKQAFKMDFQIVRWSELTCTEGYKKLRRQIQADYDASSDFFTIVNELATEFYKRKKCHFESARNYLLDECAVYLMFDGKTTYPDKELNRALQYAITKYKSPHELEYVGYDLGNGKIIPDNSPRDSSMAQTMEELKELRSEVRELKNMIKTLIQNQATSTQITTYQAQQTGYIESVNSASPERKVAKPGLFV